VRYVSFVVRKGILALCDRAAMALEEMAIRRSVCVQGLDRRENCSAEAVCSHVRVDASIIIDTVKPMSLRVYKKTGVAMSPRDEESKQALCDVR